MSKKDEKKEEPINPLAQQWPNDLAKAAHDQDPEKVKECLANGDKVDAMDSLWQTPLIFCVRNVAETEAAAEKLAECAQLLIEAGSDTCTPDKYGDAPLHLAVMDGGGVPKTGAVKALIEGKADVLAVSDNFKMTALHWAAVGGHIGIAKVLVDAGARKNKIDRQRCTPLEVARKQLKRLQDNLDHFGNEYKGNDKGAQMKKYGLFIAYMEGLPGIKKD